MSIPQEEKEKYRRALLREKNLDYLYSEKKKSP